jgi:hypothetical protein
MKYLNFMSFHIFVFFFLFIINISPIFCSDVNEKKSDKVIGKLYLKVFLSHLHKEPSRYSASLTTLQCSQSVLLTEKSGTRPGWIYAKVGNMKGYIEAIHLTTDLPDCFQLQYSQFYNALDLDLAQMHNWGKLYDHYLQGKSNPK